MQFSQTPRNTDIRSIDQTKWIIIKGFIKMSVHFNTDSKSVGVSSNGAHFIGPFF